MWNDMFKWKDEFMRFDVDEMIFTKDILQKRFLKTTKSVTYVLKFYFKVIRR